MQEQRRTYLVQIIDQNIRTSHQPIANLRKDATITSEVEEANLETLAIVVAHVVNHTEVIRL